MAREGYCGVCGRKTSAYVESDGVLCDKHLREYEDKRRRILDEEQEIQRDIKYIEEEKEKRFPALYTEHTESTGKYIHTCVMCRTKVRSNDDSPYNPLCVDHSQRRNYYYERIQALKNRSNELMGTKWRNLKKQFGLN